MTKPDLSINIAGVKHDPALWIGAGPCTARFSTMTKRALLGIRIRGLRKGLAYEFNKGMADQTGFRDFGRACYLTFWFRKGHGLSRFVVAHEFAHYARYVNDIESDSPDDERETSELARALLKCARAED